jgi:hypothetical protein
VVILNAYMLETGRSASRQSLAESVPVVVSRNAGRRCGYYYTDMLFAVHCGAADQAGNG